ncbi:phage portal protein [Thermomicrobium sp. 4228-Ro]|uniref:phage portal protein n=1 Tax=Thermomicrobium sp. 4228-Ro TaxID=2993937 RepID=UPI002248FF8B|nr:phage portal protein [Thermomicrobium sp. 4228-Ro]MCX2726827.1 phage portal protein [Thermomicrobium sp. 4228-Ro]
MELATRLEPTAADRARWARYRDYLAFWDGRQWDARPRPGETRLTLNYARALVRKVTSVLFSRPVRYSVPDSPAAERALAQLATEDDWHGLDYAAALDTAVLGDAAFKVTWDAARRRPRLTTVDPAQLVVAARPDDPRELVALAHEYPLAAGAVEQVYGVALPGLGPDGRVTVREEWTDATYRLVVAGETLHAGENPYGWIPYVLVPNTPSPGGVWGESDLADLLDVCRELNRRLTVLSRILQVSGNPIVVLENVTASEGIRAEEGAVWELPEGSRAYLLDMLSGGGVALHLEYVRLLFQVLHDLAEVPRAAFGDQGRDLSGAALELELQPLVHKVERKRRSWERALRQRAWRVLDLLERFGGADFGGARGVEVVWGPVLPVDEERAARVQVALVGAGIRSRLTAARELGALDPEAELARVAAEQAALAAPERP